MEEVDTLSLKMENAEKDVDIDEQIYQYNIYINFLKMIIEILIQSQFYLIRPYQINCSVSK